MLTITRLQWGDKRAVPLRISSYQIDVNIKNQLSRTEIEQVFINPNHFEVDGIYIFPLANNAMVSGFTFSIDGAGRHPNGKILTAEEARYVYEESVEDAAKNPFLKYVGTRAFAIRILGIPANGECRIRFSYSQTLLRGSVFARYTHPLSLAKATQACIENFRVDINIKSDFAIRWISSPSHEMVSDSEKSFFYAGKDLELNRDFAFEYIVSDRCFGLGLVAHPGDDDENYFMLFIDPNYQWEQVPDIVAKDIIFVLDRSERMAGEKIHLAKEILRSCISKLTYRDRFSILAFNSDVMSLNTENGWEDQLGPAVFNELLDVRFNRKKASVSINDIEPVGRPNIEKALITTLQSETTPNRPRIIVCLTDGSEMNSVARADRILKNIAEANTQKSRIFVFGIGDDVNTYLLDGLAADNSGTHHRLEPNEDIEVAVSSFLKSVNDPVLTNIEIYFEDILTQDIYPQELPDFFSHEQITLVGRYKRHDKGRVRTHLELRGYINGEMHDFSTDVLFDESTWNYDFLPRLWGQHKIAVLIEEIEQNGSSSELVQDVQRLSEKYGLLTPYTEAGIPALRLHPDVPRLRRYQVYRKNGVPSPRKSWSRSRLR